ncbi:hypothetical protein ACC817_25745 [Rhizobium ruizarguesonis]|uniref:hypothetical protein n=1 Tax=Rhizobium ruizarguesonis TaxID=2081791 RepID=UPI00102F33ED|nr:hypothetical protein [Rhizobium ruizarguesonis]TAY75513.1 hypothetical protein ELH84_17350 [Rhizobium ruizarguesonis]
MKSLELIIERIILSSRWILVVFYTGLVAALAVYAVSFAYKFHGSSGPSHKRHRRRRLPNGKRQAIYGRRSS